MRLDGVHDYLAGRKFSNGLHVPIARPERAIPDRLSVLEERIAGKRVIHLGCVDHLPLIEEKLRANKWLHSRLVNRAERCLGVDINQEGIDFMRERLGYVDVDCADVLKPGIETICSDQWDFLVMGEILEHIDNPVEFLARIRENYRDHIERVVITVPNALTWKNVGSSLRREEFINSDHRYWFTPYTLGMVLHRAGITPEDFIFCESAPFAGGSWKGRVRRRLSPTRLLFCRYPSFRSTLVMEGRLR